MNEMLFSPPHPLINNISKSVKKINHSIQHVPVQPMMLNAHMECNKNHTPGNFVFKCCKELKCCQLTLYLCFSLTHFGLYHFKKADEQWYLTADLNVKPLATILCFYSCLLILFSSEHFYSYSFAGKLLQYTLYTQK